MTAEQYDHVIPVGSVSRTSSFGPTVGASLPLHTGHARADVAIDGARIGRYKSLAAAATTAATIRSHSNPGSRVTVMKSFTP